MDERRHDYPSIVERLARIDERTLAIRTELDKIDARLGVIEIATRGQAGSLSKLGILALSDLRVLLILAVVVGAILGRAGFNPLDILG
ncbi:MAG: hypothetical protein ACREF4_02450 [Gammaproteobacteria bacterium]